MRDFILEIRKLYELKSILDTVKLNDRLQSLAEKNYDCILLADYFLSQKNVEEDEKIFDMLIIQNLHKLVPEESYEAFYEAFGDIIGDSFPSQVEMLEENNSIHAKIANTVLEVQELISQKNYEKAIEIATKAGFDIKEEQIRKIFEVFAKIKSTYRRASQLKRKESVAEHIYSSLLLAKIIMENTEYELDKSKTYKIFLHHDDPEMIVGDTDIIKITEDNWLDIRRNKFKGQIQVQKLLPKPYGYHTTHYYKEYHDLASDEADFAKAIQSLDAELHEMNYDADWEDYTEAKLRERKDENFEDYPLLQDIYEETILFQKEKGNL